MANPARNRPFLTTREMSVLALEHWPALAKRYLAANEAGRRALLASTVDRAPRPTVGAARTLITRDLGSLDYFASASDLCRAYASLAALTGRPGLSPIGQVLSLNDAGLDLDPAQWKTTWYKGGYEPQALDPGLPGHHPDRAELRRHRARREPAATHRRGHGAPGPARGDQRGV